MRSGILLQTRPYGTEYKGVCGRDLVTLLYAPLNQTAAPEDVPIQPYSIHAAPEFQIIKLPAADATEWAGGALVWQDACNGPDNGRAVWFGAADAFHAVQGVRVMEQAVRDVRAGKLKPAPCPEIYHPESTTCAEIIVSAGEVKKINQIDTCTAAPGTLCYAITVDGETILTITAKGDRDSVMPQGALSISVEQYLVVT